MRTRSEARTAANDPPAPLERAPSPATPPPAATKPTARHAQVKAEAIKLPMPDPVNEIVIIAAALVSHEVRARLVKALPVDSFFAKGHPEAWAAICELDRRGLAYDPMTVRQISNNKVDTNYLDDIIRMRPELPPNLDHHIEVMRWDRTRVEVIKGPLSGLVEAIRDPLTDQEVIRRNAEQILTTLKASSTHRYLRDPQVLAREQMAAIRARRGGAACFPYGIDGFDVYGEGERLDDGTDVSGTWRLVPGCAPKGTTVITGVSGSGKTTVTANIALAQANLERRVLFGAWEQGSGMTLEMMAAHSLGISKKRLMTGQISDAEEAAIELEMDRLGAYVRFFEIPFGRKQGEKILNDRALDTIQEYIGASRCDVAIFDLWRRALRQFDPDEEECALYRQQAIAQETGIHQILIHQQRLKDLEAREDKQPTREGLKGSGAWVEVPDTIIGVHRESLFKAVPSDQIRLLVLKQRFGVWPLAVDLDFDPDTGAMTNGRSASYAVRTGGKDAIDAFLDAPIETKGGAGGRGSGGRGGRGRR
jgi:replicative DNA helicase